MEEAVLSSLCNTCLLIFLFLDLCPSPTFEWICSNSLGFRHDTYRPLSPPAACERHSPESSEHPSGMGRLPTGLKVHCEQTCRAMAKATSLSAPKLYSCTAPPALTVICLSRKFSRPKSSLKLRSHLIEEEPLLWWFRPFETVLIPFWGPSLSLYSNRYSLSPLAVDSKPPNIIF